MTARPLTPRGVKAMLTREGVDYSALTITHDPEVWRDVETGVGSTSVKVEGPSPERRAARWALMEHGLSVAPYPNVDYFSRRR